MSEHRLIYKGKWTFNVSKQFILNPNISLGAKGVFLAIKSHCASPDSSSAFPSSNLLADALNVNRSTVFKYVDELKELGFIKTEQSKAERGKFAHTIYFLFDEPDLPCAKKPHAVKPCAADSTVRDTVASQETPATKPAGAGGLRVRSEKQKEAWRLKLLTDAVRMQWLAAHKAAFPTEAYQFTGADLGQLRLFLRQTTLKASEIIAVAVAAWKKGGDKYSKCGNLESICYLCSKFNEIKSEIKNGNNTISNSKRTDLGAGTRNDGRQGQYRDVGKVA